MNTQKSMFFALFTFFIYGSRSIVANENPTVVPDSSSNITSNCPFTVYPHGNPLEQLLDYMNNSTEEGVYHRSQDTFTISVANENDTIGGTLICKETNVKDREAITLEFKVPFPNDYAGREAASKFSEEVEKAIETKSELPFAAFHFVKNSSEEADMADITISGWPCTFYKTRMVNAGRYGDFLCFNKDDYHPDNYTCMNLRAFAAYIRYAQP